MVFNSCPKISTCTFVECLCKIKRSNKRRMDRYGIQLQPWLLAHPRRPPPCLARVGRCPSRPRLPLPLPVPRHRPDRCPPPPGRRRHHRWPCRAGLPPLTLFLKPAVSSSPHPQQSRTPTSPESHQSWRRKGGFGERKKSSEEMTQITRQKKTAKYCWRECVTRFSSAKGDSGK